MWSEATLWTYSLTLLLLSYFYLLNILNEHRRYQASSEQAVYPHDFTFTNKCNKINVSIFNLVWGIVYFLSFEEENKKRKDNWKWKIKHFVLLRITTLTCFLTDALIEGEINKNADHVWTIQSQFIVKFRKLLILPNPGYVYTPFTA